MSEHLAAASPARRFGKPDLALMGSFLRAERQAKGMSLRSLAERCGMSVGAIRDLDRAVEAGRAWQAVVVHRAREDCPPRLPRAALG